ncbi:MAG: DMT family transporter [Rhodospirillales bacterium]|jgi:drug/metabolite transporter (DMT)-like permease|nr:DMT family transporter [Rhodospirillales bacterium]
MSPRTATSRNPGGAPNTQLGMVYMLACAFAFAAMNAIIRHLSADLHPLEIAFFRSLFGLLAFAPVFIRHGIEPLRTRRPAMHLLRGGLNVVSMTLFFTAISLVPLAKVAALGFTAPLFATILAVALLGEAIRARRITALVVGFTGTMIILRPGFVALDLGAILVLVSSLGYATGLIVIKSLTRTESSTTISIYAMLFTTPATFLLALSVWQTPSWTQVAWMAAIGAIGSLAHLAFAEAVKAVDITAVMPLDFTKLVWSAIIGYLAFAEVPDAWTWLGGTVIFAAVVYIAYREKLVRAGEHANEP